MAVARSQMRLSKPGEPEIILPGGHIVRHRGLRGQDHAVAHGAVAGHSGLSGEDGVFADDGRAGQPGLRAQQGVFAHARAVAHLHQVVDFRSAGDLGRAHGRAVDAGVGLNVDPVADDDRPGLRDLLPAAFVVLGETEAVAANHDAIFERDVIAEDAVFADDGVRMREEIAADLDAGVDGYMGQKLGARPDAGARADDDVSSDMGALADDGAHIDCGGGVNAGRIIGRLVKEAERAGKGVVGVLDAERGNGNLGKFRLNQHCCGVRGARQAGVAGIGHERNFGGPGLFNSLYAGDFHARDRRGVPRPASWPARLASLSEIVKRGASARRHRHLTRDCGVTGSTAPQARRLDPSREFQNPNLKPPSLIPRSRKAQKSLWRNLYMTRPNDLGGSFTFANTAMTVQRMGYGAMQLAGPRVWGPPRDREQAIAVLREAIASGVNHIDTSDYYGPYVTNQIIREALHPYPKGLVMVTKVGARRGPDASWLPARSPQELIDAVDDNLRNLGLDALDVVNLRMGGLEAPTDTPIEPEFSVLAELRQQGKIRELGLSNVTPAQLKEAQINRFR